MVDICLQEIVIMVYYCGMKREILGFPRPVPREIPRDGRPEGFPEGPAEGNPVFPDSFHNCIILVSSKGFQSCSVVFRRSDSSLHSCLPPFPPPNQTSEHERRHRVQSDWHSRRGKTSPGILLPLQWADLPLAPML